jgi:hypothetical protein
VLTPEHLLEWIQQGLLACITPTALFFASLSDIPTALDSSETVRRKGVASTGRAFRAPYVHWRTEDLLRSAHFLWVAPSLNAGEAANEPEIRRLHPSWRS